jgi:hypothetical protein
MDHNLIFIKKTQSTAKNRKKDRIDASLQVDHLDDIQGSRSRARPPIREVILIKCINMTWIGPNGRSQKHTVRCVFFKKNCLKKFDCMGSFC